MARFKRIRTRVSRWDADIEQLVQYRQIALGINEGYTAYRIQVFKQNCFGSWVLFKTYYDAYLAFEVPGVFTHNNKGQKIANLMAACDLEYGKTNYKRKIFIGTPKKH